MSPRRTRVLLLDDDPQALAVLRHDLKTACPDLEVETRTVADVSGRAFDVYVVDNDFGGDAKATALLDAVRATAPHALVLAWSARLDAPTLRRLLNAGCDGAFAKQDRAETAQAVRVVAARAAALTRAGRGRRGPVLAVLDAVTDLLREWNRRLDAEERAHAAPVGDGGHRR
ncbi:MAG: response regulator transcription factor [Planctomycetes bacterium]|nr:response regulator transcription factor [Planctomycetota bacterium]